MDPLGAQVLGLVRAGPPIQELSNDFHVASDGGCAQGLSEEAFWPRPPTAAPSIEILPTYFTWTPNVCKMMPLRLVLEGSGLVHTFGGQGRA